MTRLSGAQDFGVRVLIAITFMVAGVMISTPPTVLMWAVYLDLGLAGWILLYVYGEPRRKS